MPPILSFTQPGGGGLVAGGGIGGSTGATDNALLRADGTGGATAQSSGVLVDDTGNVTLPARLLGKAGADVASAGDMALGNGNYFIVTGTTTINTISATGWAGGSIIVLQFEGSLAVSHLGEGTFNALQLAGGNFSATAGDTLTLVLDSAGGFWREIGRAVI